VIGTSECIESFAAFTLGRIAADRFGKFFRGFQILQFFDCEVFDFSILRFFAFFQISIVDFDRSSATLGITTDTHPPKIISSSHFQPLRYTALHRFA
jgi:hypothetical protein